MTNISEFGQTVADLRSLLDFDGAGANGFTLRVVDPDGLCEINPEDDVRVIKGIVQ